THHIITDGTSQDILTKELFALYAGEELPPLKIKYRDYAEWQNSRTHIQLMKQQEEFWVNLYPGELPLLHLPIDYPRPVRQSFEGSVVSFTLGKEETIHLKETAEENNVTLYMALLSIFIILLSKLSGQEDIIVGTPTAGRRHADLERIIGMFVNTLPLRNYPSGEKTVKEFIGEVKNNTLGAFENQEYQFEDLVDKISVSRDTGRNPVFDVMFNLINQAVNDERDRMIAPGDIAPPIPEGLVSSKFDMTLNALDAGENLCFHLEYCAKLFKEKTIKRFITYFKRILQTVSPLPHQKISDIAIITEEEKKRILYEFNDTTSEYPRGKTIHELFEEQVKRTPDNICVVGSWQPAVGKEKIKDKKEIIDDEQRRMDAAPDVGEIHESPSQRTVQISYRELDEASNRLAGYLQSKGVGPGTIVAIKTERSTEVVAGLLGILKTGGTYLPIDSGYPGERLNYMLTDSNTKVLVTTRTPDTLKGGNEFEELNEFGEEIEIIDIHSIYKLPSSLDSPHPAPGSRHPASGIAYIIYTSGSTGRPKGVLVRHSGFVNLVSYHRQVFHQGSGERMSQTASPGFDAMAFEVWPCLLYGAVLHIAGDDIRTDIPRLKEWLIRNCISISFQSTAI
ncbi:MAG: AMP-binding protein, partial [bacterium]|nr:AMP-binding protein [bacterium]